MSQTLPPIALCGQLRAGKDSVADYLVSQYGYMRFAFGDGIREVTRRLYPEAYADEKKPRALLQGFGQMARSFDPDVWVRDYFRRINRNEHTWYSPVVCTDLRQPNEYSALRAAGYVVIRVTAPEDVRLERARAAGDSFAAEDLAHETESHVSSFEVDYEVENSGTVAELHARVDAIMASFLTYLQ